MSSAYPQSSGVPSAEWPLHTCFLGVASFCRLYRTETSGYCIIFFICLQISILLKAIRRRRPVSVSVVELNRTLISFLGT